MTTVAQLPLLTRPHNNRQLFSDHYLDAVLPTRPEWGALAAEAAPIMARIAALFAAFAPSDNEAQTEQELVRPVLAALGHTFEVQPALRTPDGTKKPDYVLYRDRAAVDAAKNAALDDTVAARGALAVADAKYWDRPLDVALTGKGGDPFTNKNPSYQISFYMRYSGLTWGILTNGRRWRLYHAATAHKFDRFYEVDLKALAEGGDIARFLYFYAPFRRAALDAAGSGPTLASILAASEEYAHTVGEGLKGQVYDAVRLVAQGFLDHTPNGLDAANADLKVVYDSALIVLYRLLFVFYAEARALLPVEESPAYRDSYSLRRIARDVAGKLDRGEQLLPGTTTVWARLRDLFGIIDAGSPPLKVATFNGGLFDPARHPFLERHAVGDARLLEALDKLARVGGRFVDYRDLAERHLGTIYEGLLESHPAPLPPGDPERLAGWTVVLLNDKGERKASGSYYTPDWVVQYIVDQAVGPALREAIADATTEEGRIAAVLAVNVLDPAMGSGHFPVAATEYIARFLVDQGLLPPGGTGGEADLAYWKRRVAQNCIYGVDLNPLAVELAKLSLWLVTAAQDKPLSFLDHHLRVGNALVGANLAELQIAAPAPTPTQRRRARAAERAAATAVAAGQASMLDDDAFRRALGGAVGLMARIEATAGDTILEVKEQERLHDALRGDLNRRYERLANLAASARFGVTVDPALWGPVADYATGRATVPLPRIAAWLDEAEALTRRHRFFHWEIEFPEVFFGPDGASLGERAGFDAVIGNPPYVRQEELASYKPHFAAAYPQVYHGTADLFVYFFDQGLRHLRQGGRLSYISSNSWLRANYARPLRAFLRARTTVETLLDLGDNRVFADAPDVYPAIHIVRRAAPPADHVARVAVFTRGEGLDRFAARVATKLLPASMHDQSDSGWSLGGSPDRALFGKLLLAGRPLNEAIQGRLYYGVKTGCNDAFVIDRATRDRLVGEDPGAAAIIKPFLRGEDLRPWYQDDEGQYLIFARRGIDIDAFPSVKGHLEPFRERLEPRPPTWPGGRPWGGRKPGSYRWYELQDSVEYHAAFERPKILWPDIAKLPRFSWDTTGYYPGNTCYVLTTEEPWLLGFLASRCIWFAISRTASTLGERAGANRYRLFDQYMRSLPVPEVPADERVAIGTLTLALTAEASARRELHRRARGRILADLGVPNKGLNQKLVSWWTLDFAAFRTELAKVFKRDIPVKERDDWDAWLTDRRAEHERRTAEIVRLETELNARVYALFGLTPAEIGVLEESTTYDYGQV